MSQIQGRVIDSSVYGWLADVTVSLSASGYTTKPYVDGSLGSRDASIEVLFEKDTQLDASLNQLYNSNVTVDASLDQLYVKDIQIDASITALKAYNSTQDVSILASINSNSIQDSSIASLKSYNSIQDASILANKNLNAVQDVSITALKTYSGVQDVSISALKVYNGVQDVSIARVLSDNLIQDTSIAALKTYNGIQDTSIALKADKTYIDGSLNLKWNLSTLLVKEASLGTGLVWNSGHLDVSVAGGGGSSDVTKAYVDGSLNLKSNLNTVFVTKTAAYVVEASINNLIIEASGTWNLTLPNTLDAGFQATVVNNGPGTITLEASTLYATDGSVALRDKYAGASFAHKGSGVWYAWGNLK